MKIKIIFIMLALTVCAGSGAQNSDEARIKDRISKAAAEIKTMQCEFVQTKQLKLLGDKMTARGKMYYKQGNKLRWEYTSPYTYTFILNDAKVYIAKGGRNDVIDTGQNAMFKEIVRIMMNCVTGRSLTDEKEFTVSIAETPGEWTAKMTPQRKEMKKLFRQIVLRIDKKKATVAAVELTENGGDTTVIEMRNVTTNGAIDDKVFRIN